MSRTCHLADYRNLHVRELHVYRRVVDIPALDDLVGYGLRQFAPGFALALDLSDHGHFELSVFIHRADLQRLVGGASVIGRSGQGAQRRRRVERHGQFGVLAVDDDRQPVEGLDAYLAVFCDLFGRERLGILQVPCTLLRGA